MNHDEAMTAMRTSRRARAAWGFPHDLSDTRAEGHVIGYSAHPMVLIKTDDGERLWWAAELTMLAAPDEPAQPADERPADE